MGHSTDYYKDGELGSREKPAGEKDSTLLSLSLPLSPIRDQELGEKGRRGRGRDLTETPENIHRRREGGKEGSGGAGTGCRNNRSPRLSTYPISGLASALGKP